MQWHRSTGPFATMRSCPPFLPPPCTLRFMSPPPFSASSTPLPRFSVSCSSGDNKKGFGPSVKKKTSTNSKKKSAKPAGSGNVSADKRVIVDREGSQDLQSVLQTVEKGSSLQIDGRLNIDPGIAAKGKVDFVRVESWDSGGPQSTTVENLKMKSFSPAFNPVLQNAPFYEQLVRRLQLLESKGDVSIVQASSLPPFERWSFGIKRYLQYLVDQHAAHEALETAISMIRPSGLRDDMPDLSNHATSRHNAATAVGIFDKSLGLDRSEALLNDMSTLSKAVAFADIEDFELPNPTTQTMAYAKYLKHLGRFACVEDEGEQGCLQLLAHIFGIHVAHLTTGMRVGAKAVDCLPILTESMAVSFYRDYPEQAANPLRVFIGAVNKISDFVSVQEDQEKIMEELPKAIQKSSLLLSVLAVEQPS